jgi:hypothetical protein
VITNAEAQACRPDGTDLFKLREWYRQKYLKTLHWEERRVRALELSTYQCECCHSGGGLHVHHLSYHNLFDEPDVDLMVLCNDCHRKAHEEKFEKESRNLSVADRRKAIKKHCQKSQSIPKIDFKMSGVLGNRWRKK